MIGVDIAQFQQLLDKYPKLGLILIAGVMSKKTARTVLDLDKWQMDDLYMEMIECKCVQGVSSGTFRATNTALEYLTERGI